MNFDCARSPVRRLIGVFPFFLALCWGGSGVMAQAIDPHAVYERQCGGCHNAHAGEFARESLVRRGDRTVGRKKGKEIGKFLADGHGGLTAREAEAVAAHLVLIMEAKGVFFDQCRICHGRAADFARLTLEIENGRVTGRYSGRDTEAFLHNHGRLTDPDRATIMRMLRRQLDIVMGSQN